MNRNFRNFVLFLVPALLGLFLNGELQAREIRAIKSELDAKRTAYNAQLGRVNAAKERLAGVQGALSSAEQAVRARKQEMDQALARFRKVQELAIEHPEISPEKDRRAYAGAKASYEQAQGRERGRKQKMTAARGDLSGEEGKLRGIAVEIETLEGEMDAERLARLRKQLEREQTVETRGEASCGDHTIAQCKKLALAEARRLAVEQASALIVDSSSEVKNFELSKDQIRMQVRGIVKSSTVLEKGFVGDSGYFYRIRAVVLGQLPEGFGKKPRAARDGTAKKEEASAAIRTDRGGKTWREPVTGMEFVRIPGGSFEMGCIPGDTECDDDEKAVRTVRLDGFWMGKTEVTVGHFKQFVNDSGYTTEAEKDGGCWMYKEKWEKVAGASWRKPGFSQNDRHPVACVSWNDAIAFAFWFSWKSANSFRLPSEAQWEYACRAGGKNVKYAWGSGAPDADGRKAANIADEAGKRRFSDWSIWNGYDDGSVYTAPVGRFAPNALGLHDMTGNVWEWVQDKYTQPYGNVGTNNPIYEGSGARRVRRGGGWSSRPRGLRCSDRFDDVPSVRGSYLGFRLLRSR